MADQSSNPPGREAHLSGIAGRLSILGTVSILYLLFVGAVFLGFSGYILRINLEREISAQGSGIDEVLFAISQEAVLVSELETADAKIVGKSKDVASEVDEAQRLDAEYWSKETARTAEFMPVGLRISRESSQLAPEFVAEFKDMLSSDDLAIDRAKKLTELIAAPIFSPSADPVQVDDMIKFFTERVTVIGKLTGEFEATSTQKFNADEKVEQEKLQLDDLKKKRQGVVLKLENLQAGDLYANKARVVSFEPLLWGTFYNLIQVPTIILTLIVTIAAGGLGSVVSFTRGLLVENGREGTQLLFVSVGEGVAAAVAIFFLAGAGMLMFSTGGGGGAEISPYMVAFLAFVSGFMAEDAFKSIQRAGQKLFSGDSQESSPPSDREAG